MAGGDFNTARLQLGLARVTFVNLPESYMIAGRSLKRPPASVLDQLEKTINTSERANDGAGGTRLIGVQFAGAR